MLLPSLCALSADGLLPDDLRIIGTARSDLDLPAFRNLARAALEQYLPAERRGSMAEFLNRLHYQQLDVTTAEGFAELAAQAGAGSGNGATSAGEVAIFLSTAPGLFRQTIEGLAGAGLAGDGQGSSPGGSQGVGGGARICLEKPLGTDLASSCAINDAVAAAFPESRIFRIDHYLGKETVQNLLALRFANSLFEPLWNAQAIDHVQITVAETVGLESRVDFYDDTGALRDMVQNHMLQLLALLAMEPPTRFDAGSVRDEKVKVLRALRPVAPGESVTGQYRGGAAGGQMVPGYDEELGRASHTETFVALKAHIDNWRWQGVPFYLRTGKRLHERVTEIVVQFRAIPHSIFPGAKVSPNRMVIGIQPEENIALSLMAKVPGIEQEGMSLREVPLDIAMPDAFTGKHKRIAYERLLLDLIGGDQTLFVRRDEVEAQWQWIDAIRATWADEGLVPRPYSAGSWGPSAAIALAERDGVSWHE
jgi:glucose-6-phosphate 1-dehydrogenase